MTGGSRPGPEGSDEMGMMPMMPMNMTVRPLTFATSTTKTQRLGTYAEWDADGTTSDRRCVVLETNTVWFNTGPVSPYDSNNPVLHDNVHGQERRSRLHAGYGDGRDGHGGRGEHRHEKSHVHADPESGRAGSRGLERPEPLTHHGQFRHDSADALPSPTT